MNEKTKRCSKCKNDYPIEYFYKNRTYKDGHTGHCKECGKAYATYYRDKNREKVATYHKRYKEKLKFEVFQRYSRLEIPICYCCDESIIEMLTIDHIDGNGNKHRKDIKINTYKWLRDNNYPSGYRLSCWNCNLSRELDQDKICPHQKHKKSNDFVDSSFLLYL